MKPRLTFVLVGFVAVAAAALLIRRRRAEEPSARQPTNGVPYEYGF